MESFWKFVSKLRNETKDLELGRLWHVANSLHVNFYETWTTPELIKDAVSGIKKFIGLSLCRGYFW